MRRQSAVQSLFLAGGNLTESDVSAADNSIAGCQWPGRRDKQRAGV